MTKLKHTIHVQANDNSVDYKHVAEAVDEIKTKVKNDLLKEGLQDRFEVEVDVIIDDNQLQIIYEKQTEQEKIVEKVESSNTPDEKWVLSLDLSYIKIEIQKVLFDVGEKIKKESDNTFDYEINYQPSAQDLGISLFIKPNTGHPGYGCIILGYKLNNDSPIQVWFSNFEKNKLADDIWSKPFYVEKNKISEFKKLVDKFITIGLNKSLSGIFESEFPLK